MSRLADAAVFWLAMAGYAAALALPYLEAVKVIR